MSRVHRELLLLPGDQVSSGYRSVLAESSKVEEAEQIKAQDVSFPPEFCAELDESAVIVDGVRG